MSLRKPPRFTSAVYASGNNLPHVFHSLPTCTVTSDLKTSLYSSSRGTKDLPSVFHFVLQHRGFRGFNNPPSLTHQTGFEQVNYYLLFRLPKWCFNNAPRRKFPIISPIQSLSALPLPSPTYAKPRHQANSSSTTNLFSC